eukprot:TRINITY_DN7680_c0_g1_i1.p1 TRINITY_DN7680_c0_g1~~TRINITY_DN7680_c0_g1_i1.p1  ORF type:complete len:137 (-),score=37.97 TRINITY_DN7680_c0_g1_i1:80-490(-)
MKTSLSILLLSSQFLLTQSAGEGQVCEELITKWTLWSDPHPGLAAKLKVPVTEKITSWAVDFRFNKKFTKLDFFNSAKSADKDGAMFSVVNEEWSGKKEAGDYIKFAMLGDYVEEDSEPIEIDFISLNGNILCGNK